MIKTATGIRAAAMLLATSALLSRILGYGRDFLLNSLYGATGVTDVYRASFTIPDMLNYMLAGGALTVSLLPRMAQLYAEHKGEEVHNDEVDRAFSIIASSMLAAIVGLVIVGEIFTEPLVTLVVKGFDQDKIAETVRLTRIVMPAQVFFIVGGLVQANLLARQRFGAVALTPVLYNGGIVLGGLIGAQWDAVEGFSWGALVGAFLGAFVVPVWVARNQLRFVPTMPSFHPEFRRFLWTALPLMLGVSLTTVDEWAGRRFGSFLGDGAISWLETARRLMLVPVGLVGMAAGQATGSFVSRLYAQGKRDELAKVLGQSVAGVLAVALVVAAFAGVMAEPIVGFLFEHGRFGRSDTVKTAAALGPLSVGIASWAVHHVVARALYATGDTWRPMILTSIFTAASLPLYQLLSADGIVGLAWAGTVGITAQVAGLTFLARTRLGLSLGTVFSALWRGGLVALAAGGGALVVDHFTGEAIVAIIAAPTLGYLARLCTAGLAWVVVLVVVGQLVDLPGLHTVTARLKRRFRRT